MERRPDLVRIDDFGVARPVDRGSVQRFKSSKGTYRLLPSPPRFLLLEKHPESGDDSLRLRLGGEITAPGMLCDVVALVAGSGWRGELIVWSTIGASDSAARSMFFEGGNVLGAQSTAAGERLGEIMYKLGALDREQILAVSKSTTPERRFGETAVDLGFLPRERLFDLVRTQTEEIVYAALRCSEGTFWFVDGFDPSRLAYRHRVSAQTLLMEGVRRLDEGKFFRERIPSPAHIPAKLPIRRDPPDDLLAIFRACDGRRSVSEVARACGMTEFEATHALYRLATGGFVQIEPPRPNSPEGVIEIFNGAIRPITRAVDETPRGRELREHLAVFASGVGIYDALFVGAGPAGDGSVDPARVARNLAPLAGDEPVAALSKWLHDYLSFALFDATTVLSKERARTLNDELSETIAQLAPKTGPTSVYPPGAPPVPTTARETERPRAAPPPLPRPSTPKLPALEKQPTPAPETRPSLGVERPLPKATMVALASPPMPPPPRTPVPTPPLAPPPIAPLAPVASLAPIFDDHTRDPMPAPVFAPTAVDAASDLAHSRRLGRRRTLRTTLLAIAILLLAGAAAASLVVLGIVRLPGSESPEPATPTPTPAPKPKPKPTPKPEPSPIVEAEPSAPSPSPSPSHAPSPSASAVESAKPTPSDLAATQGRLLLKGPSGFRVFVDGKVVGETPTPVVVACGLRTVKVGSHGSEQKISVPCGGEIDVYAK